ncbi:Crp/Fnr family transcriptional regulator [Patescibacteria group bacterium]
MKLEKSELSEIFKKYKSRLYKKGQILVYSGDLIEDIFYISSGQVRQYFVSKDGDEITLFLHSVGFIFPLDSIFQVGVSEFDYEVMSESSIHKCSREFFVEQVISNLNMCSECLRKSLYYSSVVSKKLSYSMIGDSKIRLLYAIDVLISRFGKVVDNKVELTIPITQSDLAAHAGMARETVSREVSLLEKELVINYEKKYLIIIDYRKFKELLKL